jgi:hypothetical protein
MNLKKLGVRILDELNSRRTESAVELVNMEMSEQIPSSASICLCISVTVSFSGIILIS